MTSPGCSQFVQTISKDLSSAFLGAHAGFGADRVRTAEVLGASNPVRGSPIVLRAALGSAVAAVFPGDTAEGSHSCD